MLKAAKATVMAISQESRRQGINTKENSTPEAKKKKKEQDSPFNNQRSTGM